MNLLPRIEMTNSPFKESAFTLLESLIVLIILFFLTVALIALLRYDSDQKTEKLADPQVSLLSRPHCELSTITTT